MNDKGRYHSHPLCRAAMRSVPKTRLREVGSDSFGRITRKPKVIGLSTGLVPRNALSAANIRRKVGLSIPKFHRSIEGVRRRVTLTIAANFMLIATLDKHPCVQSGRLNLSGKDSVATVRPPRKVAASLLSVFNGTGRVVVVYLIKQCR